MNEEHIYCYKCKDITLHRDNICVKDGEYNKSNNQ